MIVCGIFLKGQGIAELWPEYVTLAVMATATLGSAVRRFRASLA